MSRRIDGFRVARTNLALCEQFLKSGWYNYRTQNGSLYFAGDILYSYGTHYPLARICGSVLLINSRHSTVTTERHKRVLHEAVEKSHIGFTIIEVANPAANNLDEIRSNLSYEQRRICEVLADMERRRSVTQREIDKHALKWLGNNIINMSKFYKRYE